MSYLLSMFGVVIIGMSVLMAGSYVYDNEADSSPQEAIKGSVAWGAGFFVLFGAEFLAFSKMCFE
jgi:hypothetical protein